MKNKDGSYAKSMAAVTCPPKKNDHSINQEEVVQIKRRVDLPQEIQKQLFNHSIIG